MKKTTTTASEGSSTTDLSLAELESLVAAKRAAADRERYTQVKGELAELRTKKESLDKQIVSLKKELWRLTPKEERAAKRRKSAAKPQTAKP
ncbi:MAG: hypothetical protein GHCLOJNM_01548 [bacterium]|nr:hypothetical protein [bacterium]